MCSCICNLFLETLHKNYVDFYHSRHPETSERPAFSDVLSALLDYEARVLFIPKEALETNPQAGVLGAPLEAGEGMYTELQDSYT